MNVHPIPESTEESRAHLKRILGMTPALLDRFCHNKMAYKHRAEAMHVAQYRLEWNVVSLNSPGMGIYRCPECDYWHLHSYGPRNAQEKHPDFLEVRPKFTREVLWIAKTEREMRVVPGGQARLVECEKQIAALEGFIPHIPPVSLRIPIIRDLIDRLQAHQAAVRPLKPLPLREVSYFFDEARIVMRAPAFYRMASQVAQTIMARPDATSENANARVKRFLVAFYDRADDTMKDYLLDKIDGYVAQRMEDEEKHSKIQSPAVRLAMERMDIEPLITPADRLYAMVFQQIVDIDTVLATQGARLSSYEHQLCRKIQVQLMVQLNKLMRSLERLSPQDKQRMHYVQIRERVQIATFILHNRPGFVQLAETVSVELRDLVRSIFDSFLHADSTADTMALRCDALARLHALAIQRPIPLTQVPVYHTLINFLKNCLKMEAQHITNRDGSAKALDFAASMDRADKLVAGIRNQFRYADDKAPPAIAESTESTKAESALQKIQSLQASLPTALHAAFLQRVTIALHQMRATCADHTPQHQKLTDVIGAVEALQQGRASAVIFSTDWEVHFCRLLAEASESSLGTTDTKQQVESARKQMPMQAFSALQGTAVKMAMDHARDSALLDSAVTRAVELPSLLVAEPVHH